MHLSWALRIFGHVWPNFIGHSNSFHASTFVGSSASYRPSLETTEDNNYIFLFWFPIPKGRGSVQSIHDSSGIQGPFRGPIS